MCELRRRAGTFSRFELDQTRETFDDRRLADARLTDQHRRVRTFAVTEDLDHLLDLSFAADGRRNLVLPRQLVERDAKVLQIRRQLVFLSKRLILLFAHLDSLRNLFDSAIRISTEPSQNVGRARRQDRKRVTQTDRMIRSLSAHSDAHA